MNKYTSNSEIGIRIRGIRLTYFGFLGLQQALGLATGTRDVAGTGAKAGIWAKADTPAQAGTWAAPGTRDTVGTWAKQGTWGVAWAAGGTSSGSSFS